MTHGIFARELVVVDRDSKENQQEFDDLRRVISEDYEPVGVLEELLVTKISVCIWRTRRLLRYESGNIARSLAQARLNLQSPLAKIFDPGRHAEIDAIVDHLSLPQKPEIDLIIRYDIMLDKQLRNAIAELDRLQCRRKEQAFDMSTSTSNQSEQ